MSHLWLSDFLEAEHLVENKINAGVLRNPEALKQLVRNQEAYKFLKNIRGSPAYWQNELYDVLAMSHVLGISYMVPYFVSSRLPLARDDTGCCHAVW